MCEVAARVMVATAHELVLLAIGDDEGPRELAVLDPDEARIVAGALMKGAAALERGTARDATRTAPETRYRPRQDKRRRHRGG